MFASRAARAAAALSIAACASLTVPRAARAADPARINGSGSALELMKPMLRAYLALHPDARFETSPPLGSSGAVKALLGRALDLAVISRALDPGEAAQGAQARAYGKTPLLMVTHRHVAKKDITTAELEAIYAGRTTTWPDGQPIRLILRPEKEAETRLIAALTPSMGPLLAAARRQPWAIVAVTDPEARDMLARTPGALGAATLTSSMGEGPALNVLSLDGVEGSPRTLADGSYRVAKDVVFVTTGSASPATRALIAFAFSAEGRAVAAGAGVLVTGTDDGAR